MSHLLSELQGKVLLITLNRADKHNAFDDALLADLQIQLDNAENNPTVRAIVIKAHGKHFCAGADLEWMQRMAGFSETENLADAKVLARVMYTLHYSSKPTIAMVQGSAFGGGAGLVAACDIGIAADNARFCFSEVKLGLIPAVISPYVVKAIGARAATWLFTTAETVDAKRAQELQLVQHCLPEEELLEFTLDYAQKITHLAPQAVCDSKALVRQIEGRAINEEILHQTAAIIAKKRVSKEGQHGLQAFIKKEAPDWS